MNSSQSKLCKMKKNKPKQNIRLWLEKHNMYHIVACIIVERKILEIEKVTCKFFSSFDLAYPIIVMLFISHRKS